MSNSKIGFHGEVIVVSLKELPKGLKKVDLKEDYVVVGESETTGNDHRVFIGNKKVDFFEKEGTLYMVNNEEVELGCVFTERHDTINLPAGTWEFRKAIEFDPISEELRQVAD